MSKNIHQLTPTNHVSKPLEGILVVALEQAVAAPYCSSRLADAGARVIKIERPEGDFARGYDRTVNGESSCDIGTSGEFSLYDLSRNGTSLRCTQTSGLELGINGCPVTTVTPTSGDNSTKIATTAFVVEQSRSYINIVSKTAAYTLVLADRNKIISTNSNVTAPNSVFDIGDFIKIYNNSASAITINQATGLTLRLAGTANVGNRTLAQRGFCEITFLSTSEAIASGNGIT